MNSKINIYATFCLCIHQSVGIWVFTVGPIWRILLKHLCMGFLCRWLSISLQQTSREDFLGHMVIICFTFWENIKLSQSCGTIYNPVSNVWRFQFLHIFINTCYYLSSLFFFMLVCVVCFSFVFPCQLTMLSIFSGTYWPFEWLFGKNIYSDSLSIF